VERTLRAPFVVVQRDGPTSTAILVEANDLLLRLGIASALLRTGLAELKAREKGPVNMAKVLGVFLRDGHLPLRLALIVEALHGVDAANRFTHTSRGGHVNEA
jgi:hypothetical protein